MSKRIKPNLFKIGNSQGIRLPKRLLEQAGLSGDIEIKIESGQLILRSAQSPRQNWEEQFKAMAKAGDDRLLEGGPAVFH